LERNTMKQMCRTLDAFTPVGLLFVRVVLGGLFVWHGIDKFDVGLSMIEDMFDLWGVPLPGLAAPAVAVIEIVGGLALIAGFMTRVVSMVLGVVMLGALFWVKQDVGLIPMDAAGAELDLAYLAGFVALVCTGPGRFSVDAAIGLEGHRPLARDLDVPVPV
jgi:putative oxidoreductase